MIDSPVNIYFARGLNSGLVKIGSTYSIPQRLRGMATEIESVELIASIRAMPCVEGELHRKFARELDRSRGLEWFRESAKLREFIGGLPCAQRGSFKFLAFDPRGPLRYPRDSELLFPRRPFRSLADILALDSFAQVPA